MTGELSVGAVIAGRYEVGALLEVAPAYFAYRCVDSEVEVGVALWSMRPELFTEPARRDSFVGSVVDMRGLRHANLRRMFDAGVDGPVVFATSQLDTDDGMLPRPGTGRALMDSELIHYASSVADALEAAHAAGHLHGRLVPSDIVHVSGLIKVGGAGLYRDVEVAVAETCWRDVAHYIAPEVRGRGAATPASDVFSLAVLLIELAAGTSNADVSVSLAALREHNAELAEALSPGVELAPDRRSSAPAELLHAIRKVLVDDRIPPDASASSQAPLGGATLPDGVAGRLYVAESSAGFPEPTGDDLLDDIAQGPDAVSTRRLRAVGKQQPEFGATPDLRTLIEGAELPSGKPPPAAAPLAPSPSPSPAPEYAPASDGLPLRAPPSGAMAAVPDDEPSAPPRLDSKPPVFVSRKPTKPPVLPAKTPRIAVSDRPELQPKLRSLASISGSQPVASLGNYAAPRAAGPAAAPARPRRLWVYVLGFFAAVAIAAGIVVIVLAMGGSGSSTPVDAAPKAVPPPLVEPTTQQLDAAVAKGPCPAAMVLAGRRSRYCIDAYESPGKGRMPESGMSLANAVAGCTARGARLCTGREWVAACRGEGDSSFPYGTSYRKGFCNVSSPDGASSTGELAGCRSAVGAFDMSGNVAEWVQGGVIMGGSAVDSSRGRCSTRDKRRGRGAHGFSDVGYRCCADAK